MAERLTIGGKSANPWDCGAHVAIVKPLKQGDVLLLAFWAKAETPPAGSTTIDFNANIQNDSAPYNSFGSAMLQVGPQWKMYLVVATADAPPLLKIKAAYTSTTIAEYLRNCGMDVLFMMDSLTRVANAHGAINLSQGFPDFAPPGAGTQPSPMARPGRH